MKNYLIIGASGSVGSEVAQRLERQGQAVRAVTGRREKAGSAQGGMRWVFADLATGEGVADAFEGVDRAFVFAPPGHVPQDRIVTPLIRQAQRRALEKVVLMTALGANAVDDAPLRRAELELEGAGLPYNIVRPNWFMQNFNVNWLPGIRQTGDILLPVGKARGSFIDVRDIADAVVRLLTTHDMNDRAFDLTGPQSLDHDEVAAILSRVSGRTIGYRSVPADAFRETLLSAGTPADYADFLLLILGFFAQGYNAAVTPALRELLGREPGTFEQYAQDHRQAWRG